MRTTYAFMICLRFCLVISNIIPNKFEFKEFGQNDSPGWLEKQRFYLKGTTQLDLPFQIPDMIERYGKQSQFWLNQKDVDVAAQFTQNRDALYLWNRSTTKDAIYIIHDIDAAKVVWKRVLYRGEIDKITLTALGNHQSFLEIYMAKA
ncbi:hypothetical protein PGT21_031222 [Puccinia graminis f. sp. tritici]|uniref:Uncharacterized protein n=1 Tax=Puccinia graminis f. sp. tritici TaxID=56615 RepID=A0A5B0P9H8_PUCGR|nr:hypothetical protein PGT21_031222 [Puccinia graminis f. sp. tritici]KAA1116796.1 hypothetical protein PGTUg99_020610 [Puccinia graminis f. sp. tritici]